MHKPRIVGDTVIDSFTESLVLSVAEKELPRCEVRHRETGLWSFKALSVDSGGLLVVRGLGPCPPVSQRQ